MRFVDVNGLAGGLSLGVARAGGQLVMRTGYLELGAKIVRANAQLFDGGDGAWDDAIMKTDDHMAWPVPDDTKVVMAVPPCSGFSALTGLGAAHGKVERVKVDHKSNDCMWHTIRYAARLKPEVVVFESVTGAYKVGRPLMQGLRDELERLTGLKYWLTHVLHDGVSLGGPATRKRYLFIASVHGPFAVAPSDEVTAATTMEEIIGDLQGLENRPGLQPYVCEAETGWQTRARHGVTEVDGMWAKTTNAWCRRTAAVLARARAEKIDWLQGEEMADVLRRFDQKDVVDGHTRVTDVCGQEMGDRLRGREFAFGPFSIRRWQMNRPGYVVTGGGPMYSVHPTEDRVLAYRELARIMGYPDEFRIDLEAVRGEKLDAIWGKNVSVLVGEWVGKQTMAHLGGDVEGRETGMVLADGDRESLIDELDHGRKLMRPYRRKTPPPV